MADGAYPVAIQLQPLERGNPAEEIDVLLIDQHALIHQR